MVQVASYQGLFISSRLPRRLELHFATARLVCALCFNFSHSRIEHATEAMAESPFFKSGNTGRLKGTPYDDWSAIPVVTGR